jgi:hypothetical protein
MIGPVKLSVHAVIALLLINASAPVPLSVPLFKGGHPRTCCGRPVCLCTHAKGAFCPFKHAAERAAQMQPAPHRHCPLPGPAVNPKAPPSGAPLLKKAPCHPGGADKGAPAAPHSREFTAAAAFWSGPPSGSDAAANALFDLPDFPADKSRDHPPKPPLPLLPLI